MNSNEDLLFTNSFVLIPDSEIEESNSNFKNYYEKQERSEENENNVVSKKTEKRTVVTIDSKDRNENMYPYQNDFASFLGKTFFNVKSIKLVSTEIPNTDTVIKDLPLLLKNNVISWSNEEDTDLGFLDNCVINISTTDELFITTGEAHFLEINSYHFIDLFNSKLDSETIISGFLDGRKEVFAVDEFTLRLRWIGGSIEQGLVDIDIGQPKYIVNIKAGNYSALTLTNQISETLNLVRRRNGKGQYHHFEVKVNLDTDVITFDSVITKQLPINSISTSAASTTITVYSNSHGFRTGDRVKMLGVKNTAGISSSILNGDFIVSVIDFNSFTYEINERAIETLDGGGNVIKTGKNAPFRLLFESEQTRIQFNTGFPNEDSSEYINKDNPISTKSIPISSASIISEEIIRISTSEKHHLEVSKKAEIINISTLGDGNILLETLENHMIDISRVIRLRRTNCFPNLDGDVIGIPSGPKSVIIDTKSITIPGNSGELIFGGDSVQLGGLKTSPAITDSNYFFIEEVVSEFEVDILFRTNEIDFTSVSSSTLNTGQIKVNHPAHSFNGITSIKNSVLDGLINCTTLLNHTYKGSIIQNLECIAGPVDTNTVDIISVKHGLFTSDEIVIEASTSNPNINGTYNVQVVDDSTLRINFIFASFTSGVCTVISGDKIRLSNTDSIPRVNGEYNISNRGLLNNISSSVGGSSIISLEFDIDWEVGDIIEINGLGSYIINNLIGSRSVSITTTGVPFLSSVSGLKPVFNKSRFFIGSDLILNSSGSSGVIGRNDEITFYRVTPEVKAVDNIGGILINSLNSKARRILRIIDSDNYEIRVNGSYSDKNVQAGGSGITVSSGFHGVRSVQANTWTGDTSGDLFRSISLQGEDYLFLSSPGLDTVVNSSGIPDVFAKILLDQSPGNMVYNSFISAPKIFDPIIAKLDTVSFKMLTSKGFPFNFNDINWSFSLEIVEYVDSLVRANTSSRFN